ncbi:MAG: hypothetical protein H5T49_00550 [Hadesarchaea archaeon]|nr:hypothetical protein [Hadesarchaea archaeon]
MKQILKNLRGISSLIAALVLIAATVAGGTLIFSVIPKFSNSTPDFEISNTEILVVGSNAFIDVNIKNTGSTPVSFEIIFPEVIIGEKKEESSGPGSGTPDDPYIITTIQQLQAIPANSTAHYALGCDIDASVTENWNNGLGFNPIFNFQGSLDGRGHKIVGIYINRTANNIGLFSTLASTGVVKNLRLENIRVYSASGYLRIGGLVGSCSGKIVNCCVSGTISNGLIIGLIVGALETPGVVENCFTYGTIIGNQSLGGIAGLTGNSGNPTIINCYSHATILGSLYSCGGLLGRLNAGYVGFCYSTGPVTGQEKGGLIGSRSSGTVENSFWDKETSGLTTSAGGVGKTTSEMKDINTFLESGWSIATLSEHTNETWYIDNGNDYPRLWWEREKSGPLTLKTGVIVPGQSISVSSQVQGIVSGQKYSVIIRALEDGRVVGAKTILITAHS